MPDLRNRLQQTSPDVLNRKLGVENLIRHARANFESGNTVANEDGTVSSVLSGSVEDKRLNGGKPTLIPFVYGGRDVGVKEAVRRAVESKKVFPSFDTNEEATIISKQISDSL